jgi:hypothetical protein
VLEALGAYELKAVVLLSTQFWLCAFLHNQVSGMGAGSVHPCHWPLWLNKAVAVLREQAARAKVQAGDSVWNEGMEDGCSSQLPEEKEQKQQQAAGNGKRAGETKNQNFQAAVSEAISTKRPLVLNHGE